MCKGDEEQGQEGAETAHGSEYGMRASGKLSRKTEGLLKVSDRSGIRFGDDLSKDDRRANAIECHTLF